MSTSRDQSLRTMDTEIRPIFSRPGYAANSLGQIIEIASSRFMPCHRDRAGYLLTDTKQDGRWKPAYVSRLVCEAFNGPCPIGKECAHGNGVRDDNRPDNLRWATRKENIADQEKHGTRAWGLRKADVRLTPDKVLEIRSYSYRHGLFAELGRHYNVSQNTIRLIWNRLKWTRVVG